jgi:hypothetical protein
MAVRTSCPIRINIALQEISCIHGSMIAWLWVHHTQFFGPIQVPQKMLGCHQVHMALWRNKSRKFRNSKRDIRSWPAGQVEQTSHNSAVELMVCSLQNLTCVDASQTSNHWRWHRCVVLHTKALQQFTHKLCLIQNHILPILIDSTPVSQVHGHWPSLDLETLTELEVTNYKQFWQVSPLY